MESVRLDMGNKLPLEFECMGEQEVKSIAETVMAYRAAIQDSAIDAGDQHKPTIAGAIDYARKAVELDNRDSSAHLSLASAYFYVKSNFELAEV